MRPTDRQVSLLFFLLFAGGSRRGVGGEESVRLGTGRTNVLFPSFCLSLSLDSTAQEEGRRRKGESSEEETRK